MALMLGRLYEALRAGNVPDDEARVLDLGCGTDVVARAVAGARALLTR